MIKLMAINNTASIALSTTNAILVNSTGHNKIMGYNNNTSLPSPSSLLPDCDEVGVEAVGGVGVIIISSVVVVSMTTTLTLVAVTDVVVIATDVVVGVGGRPTTQQQNNQSN